MTTRKTPPKERLSRSAIVDSALQVADAEGLDAVTIRRLAQDHGVTPMALYWHFKDKDQLLDAIAERLLDGVVFPSEPEASWDQQLRNALNGFLVPVRAHPNLAHLLLPRMLDTDAGLRIADHTLGILGQAGLPPDHAAEVGTYLLSAITTLVTAELGPERTLAGDTRDAAIRNKRATLMSLAPDRYPNVIAAAGTLAECASQDSYYERGVELLLCGVTSMCETQTTER